MVTTLSSDKKGNLRSSFSLLFLFESFIQVTIFHIYKCIPQTYKKLNISECILNTQNLQCYLHMNRKKLNLKYHSLFQIWRLNHIIEVWNSLILFSMQTLTSSLEGDNILTRINKFTSTWFWWIGRQVWKKSRTQKNKLKSPWMCIREEAEHIHLQRNSSRDYSKDSPVPLQSTA